MADKKNESLSKTLLVVVILCLVCAVVVSGAAVGLKPIQQKNAALDMQRNVLDAAGLLQPDTSVVELFNQRVETKLINLNTLEVVEQANDLGPVNYDPIAAANKPEWSTKLDKSEDIAGIGAREDVTKVYFINNEQGELQTLVLYIRGYGLWGTMYGLIALQPDLSTVRSVNFYEHSETPGLGGEIQNPKWVAQWEGKQIYGDNYEEVQFDVMKNPAQENHDIDALSGATLTSNGVEYLVDYWFSDKAYGPLLDKIRKGELNNG
ncbi:Na(+)-translocating NADH-quinone reductase subunit C [Pseudidiomarina terrestris]|uniref:Na(+)-translocating NADH-quinone reductase subunit C n=1 Tax=Pseudidiomarina terrestris TaxID=2820060 RepID=A0AAW7QXT0_9GAMM|nr:MULTISPECIES: Na(+)-translocating NADH-quinone reductase subunit C [unclassified Pseudidiomarina]MDN7124663.1 Na(+)-translocating NADH-quinone reductase subunit C [Pseudidiomarina sp. 1APP75-32.1]MDN7126789.1 Na(+)-translocating NADH-quinone reductase subunit C [Pseudidiomarina sp. 1APR75-33.1]MDN7129046.1 Na(+)-translocating NADH-quinone reductase subunit C [Pseudidiomarina sp. 1APR75-15]MDN7134690.1 Na(+)-translocating NADH-quinone reductase subunit C [Pseudidiomarina sp. 1ASP75-5]MDN7136